MFSHIYCIVHHISVDVTMNQFYNISKWFEIFLITGPPAMLFQFTWLRKVVCESYLPLTFMLNLGRGRGWSWLCYVISVILFQCVFFVLSFIFIIFHFFSPSCLFLSMITLIFGQTKLVGFPGKDVVAVDSPVGRLGLSVCYDLRFPELYQKLRFQYDAQVLFDLLVSPNNGL